MLQYEELTQLLGEGGEALDPFAGIRDMLPMLSVGFLIITSIVVLTLVIMAIGRFRSQRATVEMQKDIRIIRELMERRHVNTPAPAELGRDPQLPPRP